MRFPTAKMAQEWCNIKTMYMKGGEAKIQFDPCQSTDGGNGSLQLGWFRVSNIPGDQRSILTLAKVGGLVGKVYEIDEKARYRVDYVRMKIACRDLEQVPSTAEAYLGKTRFVFGFEREIEQKEGERTLKSGVKITDSQSPNKKQRFDKQQDRFTGPGEAGKSSNTGKQIMQSAPPKYQQKRYKGTTQKLMGDAQKAYKIPKEYDCEKVYILETLKELESESDSLEAQLSQLNEKDQSSNQHEMVGQVLVMDDANLGEMIESINTTHTDLEKTQERLEGDTSIVKISSSPEVFITDDTIINTQESLPDDEVAAGNSVNPVANAPAMNKMKIKVQPQMTRKSERLKKNITLSTTEKNELMTRKRNLEGLLKAEEREAWSKGMDMMVDIATKIPADMKQEARSKALDGTSKNGAQ